MTQTKTWRQVEGRWLWALAVMPLTLWPGAALALTPTGLGSQAMAAPLVEDAMPPVEPPPSALWLAVMPLVPIAGGALTYGYKQGARRRRIHRRRRALRSSRPPGQ